MAASPHSAMGKRIHHAREIAGLSQQDVATRLGITRNAVSLWEKGLSCPEVGRQEPLAILLRTTTQWLMSGEGPAPANPIAERLKEARANAGFASAAEAARKLGWAGSSYAAHENGGRGIRLPMLLIYARAFGVTKEWLAAGPGPEQTPTGVKSPLWLDVSIHIQNGAPVVTMPMARFLELVGRAQ